MHNTPLFVCLSFCQETRQIVFEKSQNLVVIEITKLCVVSQLCNLSFNYCFRFYVDVCWDRLSVWIDVVSITAMPCFFAVERPPLLALSKLGRVVPIWCASIMVTTYG